MNQQPGRAGVDMLDPPSEPIVAPAAPQSASVAPEQRQQERSIRVTAGPSVSRAAISPVPDSGSDRPSSSHSDTHHDAGYRMRGKVSPAEGLVARIVDWSTGADGQYGRRERMGTTNGPGDFTALADDPDRRRLVGEAPPVGGPGSRRRTLEERWRSHCLRAIKMRDLSTIEEMRVAYVAPGLADQGGRAVLVIVGGHYRRGGLLDPEDLLLHAVKECETLPQGQPFVVLYFNADAPLTALPDADFFRELHAALPPGHRDALKVIYAVHPTLGAKTWAFWLRGTEPKVYGKLAWFEYLHEVAPYFGPGLMAATPDFVQDYDAAKRARRLGR